MACVATFDACERQEITATPNRIIGAPSRVLVAADADPVMGTLSPIAQYVAAGLQDFAVRLAVHRALTSPSAHRMGLDLHACASDSVIISLLRAGERRGAGLAASVCQMLGSMNGAVLFMDPSRLRKWNGSTVPIVTAIANPGRELPATFHGYRSPNRLIDLPADGSIQGPVFIVLPYQHPAHPRNVRLGQPTIRQHATP